MSAQPAIQLRGVVKRFGEITAVDHLDLDVPEGGCVGLLGPNGAGKSTTMRMLTARALIHQPRLVLLDEPTVGLDPQVRQELWALIELLRSEGTSILMSTHYIEEAQRLCDTVTIMSKGHAVAVGEPSTLVREHAGTLAWEVYGAPPLLEQVEQAARQAGRPTRRTGTSVSVLGGEAGPARLG